jgi:ribosomal protein L11
MHPIFNHQDHAVGAEILVRAKNGTDSAPFEDLQFIMDPAATPCVRQVYASWKGEEIVDWTLRALKEHPILQSLRFISANVRPLDLSPKSLVFQEVQKRLNALTAEDRDLVCKTVCIEITEDQKHPLDIAESLMAWKDLGFRRFAYDDITDDLVNKALGNQSVNLHTTSSLDPLLDEFWLLKVDVEWAGHMIFLNHPGCNSNLKAEVLQHARDEDLVFVARGPVLSNSGMRHSEVCADFAKWAVQVIAKGKRICIELTVRKDDENNAFAIKRLKDLGLDIFGADSDHFCFQGGPLGPKGLEPWQFAENATLLQQCKL